MKKLQPLMTSMMFSIALAAPTAWSAPISIDRLEASVNSSLILASDVQHFRRTTRLRAQLDPIFAGTSVASQGDKASDESIVQFLIDERIILQAFPVTDAEVEQEINSIQSNNHIDRNQLKSALADQGFSFDDYFELIRASAAKRNLIDRDIRTKVTISDDDVKNYFYNHNSKVAEGPRIYLLKVIRISPKSYKNAAAAYDAAKRALAQIKAGETFEEVAKRVSDDPSASSGGDLGGLSEDQMSPAFREQTRKMKIGDISPLLGDAKSGFVILKLADVKAGESAQLERMKDQIRNQLMAAEYQHQIQLWLDRQRQNAFIHRSGQSATAGLPGGA